jgi:hypothetical protein
MSSRKEISLSSDDVGERGADARDVEELLLFRGTVLGSGGNDKTGTTEGSKSVQIETKQIVITSRSIYFLILFTCF